MVYPKEAQGLMSPQYRKGKKSPWIVQYRVNVIGPNGLPQSKVKTASFRTRELADTFEADLIDSRQARKHGIENPHEQTLYFDFVGSWLKRQSVRSDYTHASFVADESKIRKYWLEYLGATALKSITTADILDRLDWLMTEKGLAPATRNRHRALQHVIFQDALMRGKVKANPVSAIPLIPEARVKKRVDLDNDKQFEAFLSALILEGPQYFLIGAIMGFTGVRVCTANALQYQDVDFKRQVVMFRRIEERAGGSKIVMRLKGTGQLDNEEDFHVVPLLPRLAEIIAAHRKTSEFTKPTDFVATGPTGDYVPYDTLKDVFKRAVVAAEIPPITSHALRRFFATQMKRYGFSRAEIREMGGWSSEQIVGRYDIRDVQHLADKAKALGFGNVVQMKKRARG